MHDALTAHPKYQEFEQRLADAEAMATAAREQDATLSAAYQEALANVKPGDAYPVAPEASVSSGWLFGQRSQINGERQAWMSQNFDEIEARFFKAEDALIAKAAKVVAELDGLTAEVDLLTGTAGHLASQAQRPQMVRHGAGHDTVANLIAAVRNPDKHLFREPYAVGGPRPASHVSY